MDLFIQFNMQPPNQRAKGDFLQADSQKKID